MEGGGSAGALRHTWGAQKHSDTLFLCRMFASYHGQFSIWQTLKLSLAWKSVVAVKEVYIEKRVAFLLFVLFLTLSQS